jgi:hypothetical protein
MLHCNSIWVNHISNTHSCITESFVLSTLLESPWEATNKNKSQNESAREAYTGTSARLINCLILKFLNGPSQPSFLSKKYIKPKTGESIM